jgi:flagellar biogenesis protein FliO
MNLAFIFQVVWAFALVALLLVGMTYVARAIQRGRVVVGAGGKRLVSTVESAILAQNVTVHVVKVAGRYYLVGGGTGGVSLLAELASDEVEPYIESQRAALAQQRDTLLRPFARFRKS